MPNDLKARFNKSLSASITEAISLKLVISMQNKNQTKEKLKVFFELINRHNNEGHRIADVEIILSCYLQRHYVGIEKALTLKAEWEIENFEFLKYLKTSYKIIGWKELVDEKSFPEALSKIENLYNDDSGFKTIVDNLATQHTSKADHLSAKNYLLEECAIFSVLKGHVAYPSTSLNSAVTYSLDFFKSSLVFHGYMFYPDKVPDKKKSVEEKQTDINPTHLIQASLSLSSLMSKFGINNLEKQASYFTALLNLTEQYLDDEKSYSGKENDGKFEKNQLRK